MTKKDIMLFIDNLSFKRNGILLLEYRSMKKIIEMCEENKIEVLGIDAFSLYGQFIQPFLEKSVDFSSEFCAFATPKEYLEQLDEECRSLFFEIII